MPSPSDRVSDASFPQFRRQVDRDASLLGVKFADALLAGEGARAEAIALRARSDGMSLAAVHGRIITPALYVVGDLWESGEIDIADEHLATVICHRVLAALHGTLRELPRRKGGHVLLAAPAGQRHAIGLRMAADVLEGAGYLVTHLGADIPSEALRLAVRRHEPDILGLSLTLADGVASLEASIEAALAARPGLSIVLGGQSVPAELVGPGVGHAPDVESVTAVVEGLLAAGQPARRALPARARKLSVVPPRTAASRDDLIARAAEEIGDVAREQTRQAERYRALVFADQHCELPNRRAFDDRFRELAALHGPPDGPPLMVMLLNVDGLKAINDELGHEAGEVALRMIAAALREHLREHDLPARLGGDEFGALLPGLDPAAAVLVAERVCAAIRAGFAGDPPPVTASCGLARFDGDRSRTLAGADRSLDEARRAGRDSVLLARQ